MKKAKRQKHQFTYSEAHNKAVKMYQRSAIFLLWAGVVNVFAIVIGVIQLAANSLVTQVQFPWPTSGFAMSFSVQILLNSVMIKSLDSLAADILMIIIGLVLGGLFAALGFFASKGKRWVLLLGTALYAIDFGIMFFVYESGFVARLWTNYAFTLVTHIVVLVACIVAIVEYYNVIHIEKVFKGNKALKLDEEVEGEVIARGK